MIAKSIKRLRFQRAQSFKTQRSIHLCGEDFWLRFPRARKIRDIRVFHVPLQEPRQLIGYWTYEMPRQGLRGGGWGVTLLGEEERFLRAGNSQAVQPPCIGEVR